MTHHQKVVLLSRQGVAIALIAFFTMFFRIPFLGGRVYFHLGEFVLFVVALRLGRKEAAASGSLGMALADVLVGAAMWAPFSFLLRGVEGYFLGKILEKKKCYLFDFFKVWFLSFVVAIAYAIVTYCLYGEVAAIFELIGDFLQGVVSTVLLFILIKFFK